MKFAIALVTALLLAVAAKADLALGRVVFVSSSEIVIVDEDGRVRAFPLSQKMTAGRPDKFGDTFATKFFEVKLGDDVTLYHEVTNGMDVCRGIAIEKDSLLRRGAREPYKKDW